MDEGSQPNNESRDLPLQVVSRSGSLKTSSPTFQIGSIVRGVFVVLIVAGVIGAVLWSQQDMLLSWYDQQFGPQEVAVVVDETLLPVVALGRLEPDGEVIDVAAPNGSGDARIQTLSVAEGTEVKAGDILATLDNESRLKAELLVARQKLTQTEAQLEQITILTRSTVDQLQAEKKSAQDTLETAEQTLKRQLTLRSSTSVSEEELDQSKLAVQNAKQKVLEIDAKLTRYQPTDSGEVADIKVAQQAVEVARTNVELAKAMLAQAYITAPQDGFILKIQLRPGERVGQPALLQMGSIGSMYARLEVYESEIPKLTEGAAVRLSASAFEVPLQGTVNNISQLVKQQTIVTALPAANTDARVVEVLVKLDATSTDLAKRFVGMQVTASVQSSPKQGEPLQ